MATAMPLKTKIVLLAVIPLAATVMLMALAVRFQGQDLARRERQLVEQAYMKSKETELRHYVELALSALQPLYASGRDDDAVRQQAIRLLASMDFGSDGYFFLYEMNGLTLMHPRQPELVGRNLWEMRDPNGLAVIQALIAQSRRPEGGFVHYLWRKPSTGQVTPKLGYVVSLERWGWMFGSGLYLDEIDATLDQIDGQVRANVDQTMLIIAGIAVFGAALIGVCGLILNLSEHKVAYAKLRLLAHQVVQSQENERAHLSRDLHDGTSQTLVSIKLLLESAIEQLRRAPVVGVPPALTKALARLQDAAAEVRRISHRLRPALLDTLGLPSALKHLGEEFCEHSGVAFSMQLEGAPVELPEDIKTVFFRVAQEALTNIEKHAGANRVEMVLAFRRDALVLVVRDDGSGFDAACVQQDPSRGIGLRNMRERLQSIGGRCDVNSSAHGTEVRAEAGWSATRVFEHHVRA
ncbi:cache domain-containing protein [Schlegelella sp. S2-27]|uniref:Cache domain-containing protein n=1 Tax=Caldimonas mangrovi TaxID=2944811 RepID=A0ABT0YT87_9BURK|nr:cache domain-containing protein [Caldimonas mangrovi]MCM5681966.1 cache domain-containing protein [Caldimonas mangrovi]